MNYKIILFLLSFWFTETSASYRSEIYEAYIHNQMDRWKSVIDRMQAEADKSNSLRIELVNYQYGYIGYCIWMDKIDEAGKYLDLAIESIDLLEKSGWDPSTIYAYRSAFISFRMSITKTINPLLGMECIQAARSAVELCKDNYFAHVQLGNVRFYAPSVFGGSKKEALEYFLKAKELMERNPENLTGNWNYLSLLIVIGQTYDYLDDYPSARMVYEMILDLEPDFIYVRNELYPRLLNKMQQN